MTSGVIEYQPQPEPRASRRVHYLLLILIVLLGGGLRFFKLDQPAIWGDEALTYSRICGSYQDLIDILQFDGFVPLHYELYQWIAAGMPMRGRLEQAPTHPLTFAQRFLASRAAAPATQPAAKHILIGEQSLVADGVKMTPLVMRLVPAIAGTLTIPAIYFLAIQIARRRVALTAALFAACSAYLLNYSRDAKMYMHFWLFCTLSVACLLWWLRVRTPLAWLCWIASSLAMCGLHAAGAVVLGIELIIFLSRDPQWWTAGAIFLLGFISTGLLHGQTNFFSRHFDDRWLAAGAALLFGLVVYLMQRRKRWKTAVFFLLGMCVILSGIGGYYLNFNRFKQDIDEGDWRRDSRIGWIDEYNRGRDGGDLVQYAATSFLLSWEWTMPQQERFMEPRTLKMLHGATYGIAGLLAIGLVCWSVRKNPRAARPSPPAKARSPKALVGRPMLWVAGWIVVPTYAFYCISMAPTSLLKHDQWLPGFESPNQLMIDLAGIAGFGPRVMQATTSFLSSLCHPFALSASQQFRNLLDAIEVDQPWRFSIILMLSAIWIFFMARARKLLGVAGAALVIYTLCGGSYLILSEMNHQAMLAHSTWHSIWIPRYMGFIWPAIAVAVAAMLCAIPTRPLRYGAIGFVIAVNLVMFWARIYHSEPPTDLICADTFAASPIASTTRTYTGVHFVFGQFVVTGVAPGEGLYMSNAWKYYMVVLSGMKITPLEFRMPGSARFFVGLRTWRDFSQSQIVADLHKSPNIDHVVVWDEVPVNGPDLNQNDLLKPQLGGNWQRTSERIFPSFDHWSWKKLYDARRREYVKVK